uniref:Slu7 domain-containing protein n=1 Tax=Ganoderma boninense TaxID=34458 RepID=A0A5K1JXF2_9APHY|nr:Slu7 domain-containing protein [Ganoderma boninense]
MQLTTGLPLLLALGARVFINAFTPSTSTTPPSTPDYLLNGLFQGVLIHNTLTQVPQAVVVVVVGVLAKLVIDFVSLGDVVQTACTVLGVALGVLFTDLLAQFVDGTSGIGIGTESVIGRSPAVPASRGPPPEPPKRIRLVSFGRDRSRSHRHREREQRDREREREREHAHAHDGHGIEDRHGRSSDVRAITPTLTYCSTAPSISLDSVPSSIDPEGKLTPKEREVAVLRARASLADSERRRFKEERKWAMSQGNVARASQLAWQVKRYTALMESFHREADAKVVEETSLWRAAARVAAAPQVAGASSSSRRRSHSRQRKSSLTGGGSTVHGQPLVSVSIGASPRSRKRSGGTSTLKPAIFVQGRE